MGATGIGIAGLAVSVIGSGLQMQAAKKARKQRSQQAAALAEENKKTAEIQGRQADIRKRAEQERVIAARRVAYARIVNLQEAQIAGGAIGAPGSTQQAAGFNLTSQANRSLSLTERFFELNRAATQSRLTAQSIANRPLTAGASMGALGSFVSNIGGKLTANRQELANFNPFGSSAGASAGDQGIPFGDMAWSGPPDRFTREFSTDKYQF
jgi:hypothetical protein